MILSSEDVRCSHGPRQQHESLRLWFESWSARALRAYGYCGLVRRPSRETFVNEFVLEVRPALLPPTVAVIRVRPSFREQGYLAFVTNIDRSRMTEFRRRRRKARWRRRHRGRTRFIVALTNKPYWGLDTEHEPQGIRESDGRVSDIRVEIDAASKPARISADESPSGGIVISGAVVIDRRLRVRLPAGVLERVGQRAR